MFTSFDPIFGQHTDPTAGLTPYSSTGLGATDTGQSGFQSLLIQLLTQLINQLEASNSRLSLPAANGNTPSLGAASTGAAAISNSSGTNTTPVWVLPGPATTLSPAVVQQAYAPVPPAVAATNAAVANTTGAPAADPIQPSAVTPATTAAPSPAASTSPAADPTGVMAIGDFPHPADDNGRGMHWIPTVSSSPAVVDRFVAQLKAMHVKWVTFLNDGTNTSSNDYLVQQLKANGMEPVMRVYTSGLQPIGGDLGAMVRHYKALGVSYFQLYNEPNVTAENNGKTPDVTRYLDLWLPAAKIVAQNGGYPGFGALSPGGEAKDTTFLSDALDQIKARGETSVLNHAWLDIHNYQGNRQLSDPEGFSRYKVYADLLQQKLGRLMPMIGTEGGTFTDNSTNEAQRTGLVTDTYRFMENREPYNFAYSYWVIANQAGGGHDPAWEWQALIHPNSQSSLVSALDNLA